MKQDTDNLAAKIVQSPERFKGVIIINCKKKFGFYRFSYFALSAIPNTWCPVGFVLFFERSWLVLWVHCSLWGRLGMKEVLDYKRFAHSKIATCSIQRLVQIKCTWYLFFCFIFNTWSMPQSFLSSYNLFKYARKVRHA